MKTYEVFNRSFDSRDEAIKFCKDCDIDVLLIEEVNPLKKSYIKGENGYSREQIQDCIELLNDFNITVVKKAFHTPKYWELVELIEEHLTDVNKWIFNRDTYAMRQYKQAIEFKTDTKKTLDNKLKYAVNSMIRDLYGILNDKEIF